MKMTIMRNTIKSTTYTVRELLELFSGYEMDTPVYVLDVSKEDWYDIKTTKDWKDNPGPNIPDKAIYLEI